MLRFLLFLTMLIVTANINAGIYKWVDENGQVQYGDRPPPEVETKDEVVIKNQESGAGESTPVDRKKARDRLLKQYQQEREEKKETEAKKRQEKKRREAKCSYAKSRLTEYLEHGSLYRRKANQEREYLTDQERDAAIARARAEVKKWCK
jgi:hypothetical protein